MLAVFTHRVVVVALVRNYLTAKKKSSSPTTHTHTLLLLLLPRAFREGETKKKRQNETPGLVVKKAVRSFLSVLIFLCLLLQSN